MHKFLLVALGLMMAAGASTLHAQSPPGNLGWQSGDSPITSPRPLESRALDNLVAFTRLFGYVRYFHPSSEAVHTDWNEFAVSGARAVEPAATAADLVAALNGLEGRRYKTQVAQRQTLGGDRVPGYTMSDEQRSSTERAKPTRSMTSAPRLSVRRASNASPASA